MQSTKAKSNWYLLLEHEFSHEVDKLDYDKEHNIHYDTLASFMDSMPVFHGKHYYYLDDGVKLCYSEYIHPEQPINVIVPNVILRNMADCVLYKEFTRR